MNIQRQSFVRFIYPFAFAPGDFEALSVAVTASQWASQPVWQPLRFNLEDTTPHVRRCLEQTPGSAVRSWQMEHGPLQSPRGLAAGKSSLPWELALSDRNVAFRVCDVVLLLFEGGVGFVAFECHAPSAESTDWFDLLHYGRFLDGSRAASLRITRRTGLGADGQAVVEQVLPGMAVQSATGTTLRLGHIVRGILTPIFEQSGQWYSDVFVAGQMLPYACLFADQSEADSQQDGLYRLQNFFHGQQQIDVPPTWRDDSAAQLLLYARDQWFVTSLDGGGFVAFNPPGTPFFEHTLPDHLRDQYFLLFVMALYQRFAINLLSERVIKSWPGYSAPSGASESFDDLCAGLRDFAARGYFPVLMQREHHQRVYELWRRTFQISELFADLRERIGFLFEHIELTRSQRLEDTIGRLSFTFGMPSLTLAFLDTTGFGAGRPMLCALSMIVSGVLGWFAWTLLVRRNARSARRQFGTKRGDGHGNE